MEQIPYVEGLHRLTKSIYAYLLPDGSWGNSNAGFVYNESESLIIDTLYDLNLTGRFKEKMEKVTGAGKTAKYLVNTHANGDHFFGNELFEGSEIIASRACAAEMHDMLPGKMATFSRIHYLLGGAGSYFHKHFRQFHFRGIKPRLPSMTFSGKIELNTGKLTVQLIEVGPAHTKGDIMVFIPEEKVLFAADIVFINVTPIVWAGPMINCINACNLILDMDVDIIVPGHGPVTDKAGVERIKAYYEYVDREARLRYERGMNILNAALDIDLKEFGQWSGPEKLVANVAALYRELKPESKPLSPLKIFNLISQYKKKKGFK